MLQRRRKTLTASGNPYRASATAFGARYVMINPNSKTNMSTVAQKVLSARMLRVKQLQNELNNAHYQINELTTENRMLHTLQKRQDLALRRFEDKKAELPVLLNAHAEEVRMLRATMKQLRAQIREMEAKMKERDNELTTLRETCTKLTNLCNNKQLEERDALQKRVESLTHRNEEQAEHIKLLNRKIALETKNCDHRLKTEVIKHRKTQEELSQALEFNRQLQATIKAHERSAKSELCSPRGNLLGGGISSSTLSRVSQTRFPELQNLSRVKQEMKYFAEDDASHNRQNKRFSLLQEQPRPQTSDDGITRLEIRDVKKINSQSSAYGLKQRKHRTNFQNDQHVQEDSDSLSQQTVVSSGGEYFEEEEELNITAEVLSKNSTSLDSRNMSDSILDRQDKKISDGSSEDSHTIANSTKMTSCSDSRELHFTANVGARKLSSSTRVNEDSSEEHSAEEITCKKTPSSTSNSEDEKPNIQVQMTSSTTHTPERNYTKITAGAEGNGVHLKQQPKEVREDGNQMFKKNELLAALEAIDKGEDSSWNVTQEHHEITLDRVKSKTELMRDLFGNS